MAGAVCAEIFADCDTHKQRSCLFFFFTDVALLERIRQSMDYGSVFERRDKLEKAVRVEEVSSGVE